MTLHSAGLVGILVAAFFTAGCGLGGGAKAPLGTTTLTNAMVPDAPLPAALFEEDEEPVAPPVETWGVRPATPEELATYGF